MALFDVFDIITYTTSNQSASHCQYSSILYHFRVIWRWKIS